ncbi:MAG TPA: ABC transporter ATP-binding protein [Ramlibacter sp.]|nr:ABC transporter ATP-binding protein [Ramlibacter sp.]
MHRSAPPRGSLAVRALGVEAAYGSSQVLFGLDMQIRAGECVTLLGRNGMGKSTLVKLLAGLVKPTGGRVEIQGADIGQLPPHRVSRLGVGLVPEGRRVFGNLTVFENLVATARTRPNDTAPWDLHAVHAMFPRLKEREHSLAATLSGGEQQMLAIGRALMTNPQVLILDEATEGLAPLVRGEIWRALSQLKQAGLALLVIDKCIGPLLALGDRHYVLEKGRVVWCGTSGEFRAKPDLVHEYLGV